jgi:methionyl-tRNA formyltransferase
MSVLRIIFAGSGEFGLPTLNALLSLGHDVVQVISQPDRPAGRGKQMTPTPLAQRALEAGLPLLRTDSINRETLPAADVMVVIAFGQKISDAVVNAPRLGSVNLHASRLPRYRGAAPINWAILRGETTTGNSVIRLAQRMDAGAVLGQSSLAIGELETAGELHDRLSADGATLVPRVLSELAAGTAREVPQDESLATQAPKLAREDARLDWTRPAAELALRIRGLYPWPGCAVKVRDAEGGEVGRLRLVRARAVGDDEGSRWAPGDIMTTGVVQTGDGALEIVECQPEGKRPMPLADYRRGHRWFAGLHLESVS